MDKLKESISAGISPYIQVRDLNVIQDKTGNIYKSLMIIAKRANQISLELKEELNAKLAEFATNTESLEEIQENREQIEISKYYERMPNPTILATEEFLNDRTYYRDPAEEETEEQEAENG